MSTPAPSNPNATPIDPDQPVAVHGFEHSLHEFWQRNSRAIYAFCVIVLIAIIGKGGFDTYTRWQDDKVAAEYATASTNDKLKAFAAAHPNHQLAGAAKLRLADDAYSAGNYTQAILDYQTAADVLKTGPFAGRARLGNAMCKLLAGQAAEGENQLKQLANDLGQMKAIRAEAAYQLASTAAQAGRNDEALKFLDQVNSIEPAGTWAQRAMMLRVTLPAPLAPAAAPAVSIPSKP